VSPGPAAPMRRWSETGLTAVDRKAFFALPEEAKAKTPLIRSENTGWESRSQVRPSTGLPDQKESIQLQYHRRHDHSWPSDDDLSPEMKATMARFMEKTHALSLAILRFFAEALGFAPDHFERSHRVDLPTAQSTLRLLHYHDIQGTEYPPEYWRAGAHTDFDCLTLLYQRTGEGGLEVCPGREAHTSFAHGDLWTPVEPVTGEIVCNIGDMLMAWSDDRFKSLFHRVRCPKVGENQRERFSVAYVTTAARAQTAANGRGGQLFQPGEQKRGGGRAVGEVSADDGAPVHNGRRGAELPAAGERRAGGGGWRTGSGRIGWLFRTRAGLTVAYVCTQAILCPAAGTTHVHAPPTGRLPLSRRLRGA